jgi:DNA-binding transcriptional LysR family regulator
MFHLCNLLIRDEGIEAPQMEIPLAVNMRHIRAFLAIAQHASFTRAADHLALSQPALTICIRQLEECLGLAVFNRTTRRVSLTFAGQEFLPTARRLLSEFEAALSNMQAHADSQRGRVAVAALPSVAAEWLPSTVSHFARTYPQVSIEITAEDSRGVYRCVRENEVNFGFAGQLNPAPDMSIRRRICPSASCRRKRSGLSADRIIRLPKSVRRCVGAISRAAAFLIPATTIASGPCLLSFHI